MNISAFDSQELLIALHGVQHELKELRAQLRGNAKPLLKVEEVAQLTGRAPYTVRRWIADGVIRAERVQGTGPKGRLLIPREELEKLFVTGKGAAIPAVVAQ